MAIPESATAEGVRFEVATKRHARELARCMRAKDRVEIKSSGNFAPEPCARMAINCSIESYAAYVGDELLGVFGVQPHKEIQVVWFMSGEAVDKYPMTFYRASKLVVRYLRGRYPLMMNMIHCAYPEAVRWVERLGFTISPPEPFGARKDLFVRATMSTQPLVLAHV